MSQSILLNKILTNILLLKQQILELSLLFIKNERENGYDVYEVE